MSLKQFHLLFISLSIVLAVVFGLWAGSAYSAGASAGYLVTELLSFATAVTLGLYEAAFLRKCRRAGIS